MHKKYWADVTTVPNQLWTDTLDPLQDYACQTNLLHDALENGHQSFYVKIARQMICNGLDYTPVKLNIIYKCILHVSVLSVASHTVDILL